VPPALQQGAMLELAEDKEGDDDEVQHREREAERQELVRLLGTAKDAERREIIRNAIIALDARGQEGEDSAPGMVLSTSSSSLLATSNGLNPAISSRMLSSGKVPLDTVAGSGRNRPTSAQRRRPSFTPAFEVVPEVSRAEEDAGHEMLPLDSTHQKLSPFLSPPARRTECYFTAVLIGPVRRSCRSSTLSSSTLLVTTLCAHHSLSFPAAPQRASPKCLAVGSARA